MWPRFWAALKISQFGINYLYDWKKFTLVSLICELIGYWWLEHMVGYIMIAVGFSFLIAGLVVEYKGQRAKDRDNRRCCKR
jgi:hypothetical protein